VSNERPLPEEPVVPELGDSLYQAPQPDLQAAVETPEQVHTREEVARRQLHDQLDQLIERVKSATPGYIPPAFSLENLASLLSGNLPRLSSAQVSQAMARLSQSARDLVDLDTWRGLWYVINYSMDAQRDFIKRRFSGEYETDDWGYDPEILEAVKPFFQFLYQRYWRVEVSGIENIPAEGRAMLVSNHSGQLPFDGSMVGLAVLNEHPQARLVRTLYASWFPTLPLISSLFTKAGQAMANEENALRLLEEEQLVAVYPEGIKGVGKLYKERYRLARFGRGGFVRTALKAGAPIIPVAVVGAEETYISLAKSELIARLIGFPFFPITITWPWLGLLGFIPLPTKWTIRFGEPVETTNYAPSSAENSMLVSQLTDQIRNLIQEMIYQRLAERKSILFG
jgi:1-acyl-sn-glycerol-3-phosphate acyltransferase